MSGFTCPYCNMVMVVDSSTCRKIPVGFNNSIAKLTDSQGVHYDESAFEMVFYKCPNCGGFSVRAVGCGSKVLKIDTWIKPKSLAKQFPDYIPQSIREDYEEAYAILSLSPKASATLSRRCLQGMIRDFWGIKKDNLYQEISALKEQVQPDLWQALNDLRQLGNIGSHMEKDINVIIDIDSNEAEQLIKLVELLIKEWYIARYERNKLFEDIFKTNTDKQAKRKGEE